MTTETPHDDDWLRSMLDVQADALKRAVDEVTRLRRRVRDLETQLAGGTASELTRLQDRVVMLEQLVAAGNKP
jgi:cell division septum initiation protein DivIVA